MISRAILTRIDRIAISGRTGPLLSACETNDGMEIEAFVKLSAGCDQGVVNLVREVIAACLASDLGLPIPIPYLVEIPIDIIQLEENKVIAEKVRKSNPIAFGSTRTNGFTAWSSGHRITDSMRPLALGILLFDAIIQNSDRRSGNPNCLIRGTDLRIIDHDLAFSHKLLLLWKAPWMLGGMANFETPGRHIFVHELKGAHNDFDLIKSRWNSLSDARLKEYERSIPPEWASARADIDASIKLIADARNNIEGCLAELGRILA